MIVVYGFGELESQTTAVVPEQSAHAFAEGTASIRAEQMIGTEH
jgi:hypothetical protein